MAGSLAGASNVSTALLRNVPLLSVLSEDELALLARVVIRKSYARGSQILGAGDPTDSLYILISGRIKVFMSDLDGKEVILAILGPNEFVGEMGLIDNSPRSANVVALEPCEVVCISKPDFKRCLADNFDMAMTVMRGLVKRLRDADNQIGSLALMDVFGRVARLLLETAEVVDGEKVVIRKLSKQDIARMIGASREMVSRVMKHLQEAGYIELRADTIVIRDNIPTPD
jgi:CRP/FNR family cyclic AMP-dependent transcriptional regulator